jgi:hypothetical protein
MLNGKIIKKNIFKSNKFTKEKQIVIKKQGSYLT